jgi:hypothetical protein
LVGYVNAGAIKKAIEQFEIRARQKPRRPIAQLAR